jgi:AraC-like ligand binding domain
MIRCVRIWTAKDGNSQFEEGTIDLPKGERGDILGDRIVSSSISFRETKSGGTFAPHDAPTRQFVITLSGTLEFKTANNQTFIIRPGDILLAEDTTGTGHSWRLVDDQPWPRLCDSGVQRRGPLPQSGSLISGEAVHLIVVTHLTASNTRSISSEENSHAHL